MNNKLSIKKSLANRLQEKTKSDTNNLREQYCSYNKMNVAAAKESLRKDWAWGAFFGAGFASAFTILTCGENFFMFAYTIPLGALIGGAITTAYLGVNYIYQKSKKEIFCANAIEK